MKKLVSMAIILAIACTMLSGCGADTPGSKVLEVLKLMGKGDWATVYDKLNSFSKYNPDKEVWVAQMTEAGKPLVEFLKDARFEVESEQFENEWSYEGAKFTDVTRVTVRMLPGQTKEWPVDFPFAATLGQTMRCEFLYSDLKENPGVVVNMGKPPLSHWVYMVKAKDEYAAPGPAFVVSDPDPEKPGQPPVASFYWIFDKDYKGKYLAVPFETYTKTLVAEINPDDGTIHFVRQVWPVPAQPEQIFMDAIFRPYEQKIGADNIATMDLLPLAEPSYNPYSKAIRESVAQILKLYTINKLGGYGAFHDKYPKGLLSIRPGSMLHVMPFTDVNGKKFTVKDLASGGKIAVIIVSSCGSCQNTGLEVMKALETFGLPQSKVVFISTSAREKLGDFEKKIGSARLVIDDKQVHILNLKLSTTPSMMILSSDSKVLAFCESHDIDNKTVFNREMNQAFK